MPVPSRSDQIAAVAALLEKGVGEERTVDDVAKAIVDGLYEMWAVDFNIAPTVPKVGFAFKTPTSAKIYHIAWIGEEEPSGETAWCVDSTTDYGLLVPVKSRFWRVVSESKDNRKDKSKPRPGSGGHNADDWKPGDVVSLLQRRQTFDIIATGDKTVLMRDRLTLTLQADSNASLKKYYQRERDDLGNAAFEGW